MHHADVVGMARPSSRPWWAGVTGIVLGLSWGVGLVQAHEWEEIQDPAKIVGPEACIECHIDTGRVWEGMHHFTTFRSMPRSDRAREIADHLGIQRIKNEGLCLNCHFTTQTQETTGTLKPIAGISCESCHGAARDWISLHSDYGGKTVTRETETPEHRAQRIAASEQAGMIRPERLYALAANCYSCHTVPQERLVNLGGHPAGSRFELVSWSQGEVRHNVWFSGGENVEGSAQRKRVMYVTGQALDLAFALHGLAHATEKADYSVTMAKRAKVATLRLQQIADAVSIPEVSEILGIANQAELKLNNEAALTKAAEKVQAATKRFAQSHDGSGLAALDALIPTSDQFRGSPAS